MAKVKGLGMGMDALFSQNETEEKQQKTLRLTEISPNRDQPRTDFDDEALGKLADSIKQHGVLQPLLVRPLETGGYQIIAGERRWRAARMAGLDEVPVVIKEMDDKGAMELALVENLQRENLNPVEEALGYKELMEKWGYTQEQVAQVVNKSRPAIANSIRLLSLDEKTLAMVRNGDISVGHAKVLAGVKNEDLRAELAMQVKRDMLTVRNLEQLVRAKSTQKKPKNSPQKETFLREIELSLAQTTGRKVTVSGKNGKGKLEIEYYSEEDLAKIARLLENLGESD
ncbi:MAG: ParB/RepB/Spo0J family partition protein [Oscillospiraceae bacterium]|nr:ParB/RepB/Spo0J family partition protein [Oscillospiraceae bacterium]